MFACSEGLKFGDQAGAAEEALNQALPGSVLQPVASSGVGRNGVLLGLWQQKNQRSSWKCENLLIDEGK